jgi:hypothetical protein
VGTKIATVTTTVKSAAEPSSTGAGDGLDLLDFGRTTDKSTSSAVRSLLDITVAATQAGPAGLVEFPDGTKHNSLDVIKALKDTASEGLKESHIRLDAGERLEAPGKLLARARSVLAEANKAIYEAIDHQEFAASIEGCTSLLDELSSQIDEARESLEQFGAGDQ